MPEPSRPPRTGPSWGLFWAVHRSSSKNAAAVFRCRDMVKRTPSPFIAQEADFNLASTALQNCTTSVLEAFGKKSRLHRASPLSPRMGRSSVARGGSPETVGGTQQAAPDGAVAGTNELLRCTSMVKRPPSPLIAPSLEVVCILATNRLVRSRMLGGVGGAPGNRAHIPIGMVIWS